VIARILYNEGFTSAKEIAGSEVEELARLSGIGIKKAQKIVTAVREMAGAEAEGAEVDAEQEDQRVSLPINELKGVGEKTAALLVSGGVKTLEVVSSIPGIGMKRAEGLLRAARDFDGKSADD
jgi:DNA uptake protein ComE-like DNA-binding protein